MLTQENMKMKHEQANEVREVNGKEEISMGSCDGING